MTQDLETKKPCLLCDKALPTFGLALGLVFVAISLDLLTGGFISRLIGGRSKVIEGEVITDDTGAEPE